MTDFPTLLNTSVSKIPTLSLYLKPEEKGLELSRIGPLREYLPPPPGDNIYPVSSAEETQRPINDWETRNTVKFSCYKKGKQRLWRHR